MLLVYELAVAKGLVLSWHVDPAIPPVSLTGRHSTGVPDGASGQPRRLMLASDTLWTRFFPPPSSAGASGGCHSAPTGQCDSREVHSDPLLRVGSMHRRLRECPSGMPWFVVRMVPLRRSCSTCSPMVRSKAGREQHARTSDRRNGGTCVPGVWLTPSLRSPPCPLSLFSCSPAIKFTKSGGVFLAINLVPLDQPTATDDDGVIKRLSSSSISVKPSAGDRASSQSTGVTYRLGFSCTDTGQRGGTPARDCRSRLSSNSLVLVADGRA